MAAESTEIALIGAGPIGLEMAAALERMDSGTSIMKRDRLRKPFHGFRA